VYCYKNNVFELPLSGLHLAHSLDMFKILVISFLFVFNVPAQAYESDQFTLPNQEVADVGVDISKFVYEKTVLAIEKINNDLKNLPEKIELTKKAIDSLEAQEKPLLMKDLKSKLAQYSKRYSDIQTNLGITKAVYREIGPAFSWEDQRDGVFGLSLSIIPYPKNIKDEKIITFVPKKTQNIYAFSGFHRLISPAYFVFCSSLKMFGVYFGVDKLGHIFNQGYEYYETYEKEYALKNDSKSALQSIIEFGRKTENGMFGLIVDGVYSNGDLAANMSGFHFYKNLLETVTIGEEVHAPILTINEDKSVGFNSSIEVSPFDLLRPFISQHLNEALNPSYFEKMQRPILKKVIKNRCENVLNFYGIENQIEIKNLSNSLQTWHGLDYGNRSDNLLRIDELCF
jgi:hypothetical protein